MQKKVKLVSCYDRNVAFKFLSLFLIWRGKVNNLKKKCLNYRIYFSLVIAWYVTLKAVKWRHSLTEEVNSAKSIRRLHLYVIYKWATIVMFSWDWPRQKSVATRLFYFSRKFIQRWRVEKKSQRPVESFLGIVHRSLLKKRTGRDLYLFLELY